MKVNRIAFGIKIQSGNDAVILSLAEGRLLWEELGKEFGDSAVAQARQQAIEECAKLRNALQLIADRDDCEALRYGRHGCECSSCIARESLTPPAAQKEEK